ncbi:hypothetical protein P7K49_012260 [Saguinus oedipus]|uniref:Uncharacterized protein n=1 Tax=Saguinus oedipus TaxID=9490 RepID=A0ABQ9VSZ3_SAGOE|nr:hypothetical protein P7K49_012260 [Saguinus oedipus]
MKTTEVTRGDEVLQGRSKERAYLEDGPGYQGQGVGRAPKEQRQGLAHEESGKGSWVCGDVDLGRMHAMCQARPGRQTWAGMADQAQRRSPAERQALLGSVAWALSRGPGVFQAELSSFSRARDEVKGAVEEEARPPC